MPRGNSMILKFHVYQKIVNFPDFSHTSGGTWKVKIIESILCMPVYVIYKHLVMQALYIMIIYLGLYHFSKIYFKYVYCTMIIEMTIVFVNTLLTIRIFLRKYQKSFFLVRKHMFLNAWNRFSISSFGWIFKLRMTLNDRVIYYDPDPNDSCIIF